MTLPMTQTTRLWVRRALIVCCVVTLLGVTALARSELWTSLLSPISSGWVVARPGGIIVWAAFFALSALLVWAGWRRALTPRRSLGGLLGLLLLGPAYLCAVVQVLAFDDGLVVVGLPGVRLATLDIRPAREDYEVHWAHCTPARVGLSRVALDCAEGRFVLFTGPFVQREAVTTLRW